MSVTTSYVIDAEQFGGQADTRWDSEAPPLVDELAAEVTTVLLHHPDVAGVRVTVEIELAEVSR